MIRHMTRPAALLLSGVLLASGAWGQDTVLRQSATMVSIASEYFGVPEGREVGRDVSPGSGAPTVTLTLADDLTDTNTSPTGVTAGNVARVTYTLTGATFSATVNSSALDGVDATASSNNNFEITTEVVAGGARGDGSVTFEVTVDDLMDLGDALVFSVPQLQVIPAVLLADPNTGAPKNVGVGVGTELAVRKATGTPFSPSIQDMTDTGKLDAAGKNASDPVLVGSSQVYDTMGSALNFGWAGVSAASNVVSTALVEVTMRKQIRRLAAPATDPTGDNPATATPALLVGTLDITASAGAPKDLGGRDAAVDTTGTPPELGDKLSGTVDVKVSGPFRSGDAVYLGEKSLTVSGGLATGSISIEGLLQADAPGQKVIYVPGGVDDLKPSTFTASAALSFDDSENASPAAGPWPHYASSGEIRYRGYTPQGYAYGVVKGGGTDGSFVRITCASPVGCKVFLDCADQSGMEYFGELDAIGGNATAVASSEMIASALGGGWSSGRGSCELVANAPLEVQHMVRAGHVLVNNSVVVNKAIKAHPAFPEHPAHETITCTSGIDWNGDGDRTDTLDEAADDKDYNGDGDKTDTVEESLGQTCS